MYDWRKLTESEKHEVLRARRGKLHPWHSPPHQFLPGSRRYIISAACYEHAEIIGRTPGRMDEFSGALLEMCGSLSEQVYAWCLVHNHYHLVLQTGTIAQLLRAIGRLHGRTSHQWNGEDAARGRKVWFNCAERQIRSERHLWATINYVHHNPVKHGYVARWQDWPWSSAADFLEAVGRERAEQIWREYLLHDYGETWD